VGGSGAVVCYPAARLPSQAARGHFEVIGAVYYGSDISIGLRSEPGLVFARNSSYGCPSRWRVCPRAESVEIG